MLKQTKIHGYLALCLTIFMMTFFLTPGNPAGALQVEDTTGPTITVWYVGSLTDSDPGVWDIAIEDPESGVDEVQILINWDEHVHHFLAGLPSSSYEGVLVPASFGTHELQVIAKNNDQDYVEDQEMCIYLETVTIVDDDTTEPVISIVHSGAGHENEPGDWQIDLEDLESGLDEVLILIDGNEYWNEHLNGIQSMSYDVPTPAIQGYHTVKVNVTDNDQDRPGDQESNSRTHGINILPPPIDPGEPPIIFGTLVKMDKYSGSAALQASPVRVIFPDSDEDCVCDAADNCPLVPNPNQWDADMDGIGDACEKPVEASLFSTTVLMLPVALLIGALLIHLRRRKGKL